jgi:hypothetical protein
MLGADYSSKFSPWLALGCLSPRFIYKQVKEYEAKKIKNDSLFLYSCSGNKDKMTGTDIKIQTYDSLTLLDSGKGVMIDYKIVYRTKGRIKKCFLVNGSQLLVLTDEERGYGLFRLISKNLDLI